MGEDKDLLKILNELHYRSGILEQLLSIINQNGVYDGNLISKSARDTLVEMNMVNRYNGFNFPNWRTISLIGNLNFEIRHIVDNQREVYKQ